MYLGNDNINFNSLYVLLFIVFHLHFYHINLLHLLLFILY